MFNLVDDPWISVLTPVGEEKVGLLKLFKEVDTIKALSGNPLDKISIVRLLVCISQVAVGVPENNSEWKKCKFKIQKASISYLKKWHDSFFLYGPQAFLQLPKLNIETISTNKLIMEYASGNNHTVYDHDSGTRKNYEDSSLASALVKTQLFSYMGINGAIWDVNKKTSMPASLLNNLLVTLLLGENLLSTIHLNMVTKETLAEIPVGKPVWEDIPNRPDDAKAKLIRKSYLGNLVPLTRGIKLLQDSKDQMMYSDGISGYTSVYREPMVSVYTDKNGGRQYRNISLSRHVWRNLASILNLPSPSKNKIGIGAYTLQNINKDSQNFNLWLGGVKCENAKIVDMAEWSYNIPSKLLECDQLLEYQAEIDYASKVEKALRESLYEKHADKSSKVRKTRKEEIISTFWNRIEKISLDLCFKIRDYYSDNKTSIAWRDSWKRRCRAVCMDCFRSSFQTNTAEGIMNYARNVNSLSKKLNKLSQYK